MDIEKICEAIDLLRQQFHAGSEDDDFSEQTLWADELSASGFEELAAAYRHWCASEPN